jgi:putative transposase
MAELGLAGRPRRRRRSLTRQGKRPVARDLVRRKFTAVAPDVLWCGDVTQIDTDEGPLYLATTEDLFSRRMLGVRDVRASRRGVGGGVAADGRRDSGW